MSEINNTTDDRKAVIENIKAAMSCFSTIRSAFIFGSYAEGNFDRFSDIDIMTDCGIELICCNNKRRGLTAKTKGEPL